MVRSKKIFISHSSKDNDFASIIAETLRTRQRDIWFDEYDLGLGQFRPALESALASSYAFLLLLSEDALLSYWVNLEINAALTLEKEEAMIVVPAIISPCAVPLLLSGHKRLDFTVSDDAVTEIEYFLRILDYPTPPLPSRKQSIPQEPQVPHTAQPSYSIRDIKGKHVVIHQGEQTSYTYQFYGNTSASTYPQTHNDRARSEEIIIVLKDSLENGKPIGIEDIEKFIKIMYSINEKSRKVSPDVLADIRAICQYLNIQSFF